MNDQLILLPLAKTVREITGLEHRDSAREEIITQSKVTNMIDGSKGKKQEK
jgi:hypothetical protein